MKDFQGFRGQEELGSQLFERNLIGKLWLFGDVDCRCYKDHKK